ncbi:hypothetical protein HDU93_001754, partial [Gonapodya sp. JEL0774]
AHLLLARTYREFVFKFASPPLAVANSLPENARLNKFNLALKHAQAARPLAENLRSSADIVESWLSEVVTLQARAETEDEAIADASYEAALNACYKLDVLSSCLTGMHVDAKSRMEFDIELSRGICCRGLRNFDEAWKHYKRCQALVESASLEEDNDRRFRIEENMGILLLEEKGDVNGALKCFVNALVYKDKNDFISECSLRLNLATCYRELNQIDKAIAEAKISRDVARQNDLPVELEQAQKEVEELQSLVSRSRAIRSFEQEAARIGRKVEAVPVLLKVADLNMEAGMSEKSLVHLREAVAILQRTKSPLEDKLSATVHIKLGEVLLKVKKRSEARQVAESLMKTKLPTVHFRAQAQAVFANALLAIAEYESGAGGITHPTLVSAFEDLAIYATKVEDDILSAAAYKGLASSHRRFGFKALAKEAEKKAVELEKGVEVVNLLDQDADEGELGSVGSNPESSNLASDGLELDQQDKQDIKQQPALYNLVEDESGEEDLLHATRRRRLKRPRHRSSSDEDEVEAREVTNERQIRKEEDRQIFVNKLDPVPMGFESSRCLDSRTLGNDAGKPARAVPEKQPASDPYGFGSSLDDDVMNFPLESENPNVEVEGSVLAAELSRSEITSAALDQREEAVTVEFVHFGERGVKLRIPYR